MMIERALALSAAAALLCGGTAAAQQGAVGEDGAGPLITVVPGQQYEGSALERWFLGDNWRELWTTPLRVPTLDLGSFAGGLTPERQGGGNQSVTLHMIDASGVGWVFRSVDKFPAQALPEAFAGTPVGDIIADQVSALHPTGSLLMPRLLEALGILHVQPTLYVMPDDPRLGEFRETFAGMLGGLEEKPQEGPDDTPGFAGSTKVKGTENFLEDLEDSPQFQVDEAEFLRARLVDLIVGDTDRGADQWDWVRFGEEGDYIYHPLPRDRDWAFMKATGPIARLSTSIYPKIAKFSGEFSSLSTYTYGSHVLDRRLMTRLTRSDVIAAADSAQRALSDRVLAEAVADMPPEFPSEAAAVIRSGLTERRDNLDAFALEFYDWLASEVDVRGTDEDDRADIERRPDGSLRVRLSGSVGTYYDRLFVPEETNEVRVHLHGGDDRATVAGSGPGSILVRVIGGGGDDVIEDRTGTARLYDGRGDNMFVTEQGSRVDTKEWEPPEAPEGLRMGRHWAPDWGGERSLLKPAIDYNEAGVIAGAGPSFTRYGFRRLPYRWKGDARALYSIGSGGFGVRADFDYRFLNSRRAFTIDAEATQFDVFRFYGFGNDTPELDTDDTLILQDRISVYPALVWHLGSRPGVPRESDAPEDEEEGAVDRPFVSEHLPGPHGSVSIGPVVQWTRMRPPEGTLLAEAGTAGVGQVGARALFELGHTDRDGAPRRGYRLWAEGSAYPAAWDADSPFGRLHAEANGYTPLVGETHLAVRVGGQQTFGDDVPVFESAFIGGRPNLRGYRSDRFAGDAAAYGGAEVRVPLGMLRLLLNGEAGVFGLADAGRVYVDGASPDGWHTAIGGGLWFTVLDRGFSVAYAHGERGSFYVWSGLPF